MVKAIIDNPRPVILCFVAYYLPGYRSGGPVRTIANFVAHLGDEFAIRIVTRDRDALDNDPYPDVAVDAWNAVGKARVFYASAQTMRLPRIARLIRQTPHDVHDRTVVGASVGTDTAEALRARVSW